LQGVIDLLAVDKYDAYVIDYKYSAHDGITLKERYKKQLDLYAYAVEKSLNLKVKGKFIVSLLTGETISID
ncbi:MAG: PD-(D/E)XK nuclease family protein, partial [Clostridia bacterium]|nr:PD-(D/E)XK nuclease family protein [Clostridia bacterium]